MKRFSATPVNHLSDMVKRITHIVIYEDVRKLHSNTAMPDITASAEIDNHFDSNYDQDDADNFFLGAHDDLILDLDPDTIHRFKNIELLRKVAKINPELLSSEQQKFLRSALSQKFELNRKDVEYILGLIKQCNSISYSYRHSKTNKFLQDSHGVLRESDCLDILHQLDISDYVKSFRSSDWSYIGDILVVFEPEADWTTDDGTTFHNLVIYIKLDIDLSTKDAIALVSMHEAKYGQDSKPYNT